MNWRAPFRNMTDGASVCTSGRSRFWTPSSAGLCSVFTALTLTACAAPPAQMQNLPTPPAAWWAQPAEGVRADWALLQDSELQGLLDQATAANRDLAQSALRLAQSLTQAQLGALRLQPTAALSTTSSRPLDPPLPELATTTSAGGSLAVSYELDLWGRLAALRAADAAQVRAAQTDLRAAQLLLRSRVAESYWQLAAAQQQTTLAREQLQLNRELLAAVRLRVREGRLLPIEIDRAAATLQQAEVRLADLQADAAQQRLQLALLVDQPPPGPQPGQPRLPGDLPPRWQTGSDPAAVLERRPDVQRARAQVDAALARAQVAQAQRYPSLSFRASLSTAGTSATDWLANPLGALAGNLVVPLIDWRRLDLQRDAARTELELAALALRETVARALVEVESALLEGQRLQQQLAANAARLKEAQGAEQLAALRLELGTISKADFLQARNARLETEQTGIQLRLRAWLNRSQLARALALA